MITKTSIKCIFFSVSILFLHGCSVNTYDVKEMEYIHHGETAINETSIFVFRENSAFGAARKFAIICNDTVMGVLTPGTFCNFDVESGENEIVAYMSPSPIMHYRVQSRPGEGVFLFCKMGYATGMYIEEIDKNEAEKLMNKYKYMEIGIENQKTKINYRDYYDNLYK